MENLGQTLFYSLNSKVAFIEDKIEKLLMEKAQLESENTTLKESLLDVQLQNQALLNKNELLRLSKSLNSGDDNNSLDSKKKITKIVREIDRCIALLNR